MASRPGASTSFAAFPGCRGAGSTAAPMGQSTGVWHGWISPAKQLEAAVVTRWLDRTGPDHPVQGHTQAGICLLP